MTVEPTIPEASPRTQEEWETLPSCLAISEWASARSIAEIVHFTPHNNLIGILASGFLKSTLRAERDEQVEHVFLPNAPSRIRDLPWLDYASLSVSRINSWLFGSSSGKWHRDTSWVVLSFDPAILTHPGVVFATTNNAYPECRRAEGLPGLERLFGDRVIGYNGRVSGRYGSPSNRPTDQGAEVLYPGELSLDFLQRIYVQTDEASDDVSGLCAVMGRAVEIVVRPDMFR